MRLINEYLRKIKEAIYGEEVRGSIHDAIEQCYKDATGHPDSVAAVVEEMNIERKRLDNLFTNGTAQTQEVGKTIATTSQGSKTKINFSDSNVIYTSAFDTVKISDSSFARIDEDDGSPLQILKEGLYYLNASVEIKSEESTIPPTAYMILLEMTDEQYNKIGSPIRRIIDFPPNPTFTIERQQISYLFKVEKTTNLRFIVSSIADTSDKLAFSIDDIMLAAIDWKGKQSADLSELHDLRIVDGEAYDTAGEATRTQFANLKEFSRELTNDVSEKLLGIQNLALINKLSNSDGFVIYQSASERNKIFVKNVSAKVQFRRTLASLSVYEKSQYYTDAERLVAGGKYIVFGVTSDVRIKFLDENGAIIDDTVFCNYTVQNFTIPESCTKLEIYIESYDTEIFLNVFICKYYEKTVQQQINSLNDKIDAMQQIITKLVTAPTLTADTNGKLQITENEEG